MMGRREDRALKGVTGLEGGLVACGSTCGVVSGGALGIALTRLDEIDAHGDAARKAVMADAREYVDWFTENFSTQLCRERTGLDFYRAGSWLRYFLPDLRVRRCFWHMGRAAVRLKDRDPMPVTAASGASSETIHCATEVLKRVREEYGLGNDLLERISFVLDGGVALSGGVCGAMAGAVMALNLIHGWDIREMSYPETIREFVVGHVNLLKKDTSRKVESFALGKDLVKRLRSGVASLECSRITGRRFTGWDDFQAHMQASVTCRDLINHAVSAAGDAIVRHLPL